ncbi:MAG: caspase domain-containing protein [Aquamicrobium sp.]|uniref:caspase family protein n=1 Tax=Aquamicrobium sp. TaxID=1872579 RepID=UPI00349EE819|nr:caspase domain-containing protein [Aquamicrobium sp.]
MTASRATGALFAIFVALLFALPAQAQKKLSGVALVIGQSAYEHIAPLPNPANDAREMMKLLTDLGFDARSVTDRDAGRLRRDLERFAEDAEEADVAFLYYSGHGIEAGGENWLLPVDVDHGSLDSAEETMVPLSGLIEKLKRSVPVTIVLLDACRTNPFPAGSLVRATPGAEPAPMGESGLTAVRGATSLTEARPSNDNLGTVIGFAAEPGLPALDGAPGANSPYATALLRHLAAMGGAEFGQVMRMVTEEVYLSTRTQQRPWVNESLRRQLYFGVAPDESQGDEALVTGERRQLLLTIAELPDINRLQVEKVALRDGVPLDALYGILRALDETAEPPSDPSEMEKMLEAQAGRLRKMLSERAALRTDDPEIARLSEAADRAIAEGAIRTARLFMDRAVARVEETRQDVDDLEELLRRKRIADAAIYARRADASALVFAFTEAADDYGRAFDLVEKWDEDLAWNYKNMQAEALRSHGRATGERAALDAALAAYDTILRMLPSDDRGSEWAITRNNMAVVLNDIGERGEDAADLLKAMTMFEESMAVFERLGDDANWSAAQNNIGNIHLALGQREADPARIEQAIEAFRAALARRERASVPMEWASTQINIGLASFTLGERRGDAALIAEAEAAYRAALEVFTREASPMDWGMAQNNLGNTLNALGLRSNDISYHDRAAEAFEAALEVRTREAWPQMWATTQVNLGNTYVHRARHDLDTENLEKARAAYEAALTVLDRRASPLNWASAQNNLGNALQTIGQRTADVEVLQQAVDAFNNARRVYKRKEFPIDWAMTHHNVGNTLRLMATVSNEPAHYRGAVTAFRQALSEYRREAMPMQWANTMAMIGGALQGMSYTDETLDSLTQAVEATRAALEVLTVDNAPVEWATAQNTLGTCLLNLSTRSGDGATLADALAAFEASKKVFDRDSQPLQWAFAENNIGDVHWNLAALGGGNAEYAKAIERFENAKQAFGENGQLGAVMLSEQKISLIRQAMEE